MFEELRGLNANQVPQTYFPDNSNVHMIAVLIKKDGSKGSTIENNPSSGGSDIIFSHSCKRIFPEKREGINTRSSSDNSRKDDRG